MGKKVTKIAPVRQTVNADYSDIKRVCAYCRVSTGTDEQKKSFDAQVQYYTQKIAQNPNWTMTKIYTDKARSGTKVQRRDGFQQMIQDCKRGHIDLILTKSVTRFARNTLDSIHTIRMFKELGVEVYFEKEQIGTMSEKSEQLLTILSSIAQSESENISMNIKWAIRRKFQNGTYIISNSAYGYTKDKSGSLIIKQDDAVIVRRIFDEYLGGKGVYTIAKELQKDGIPTIYNAKYWSSNVIREILQNHIYEGDIVLQKNYMTNDIPFKEKKNNGELPKYLIRNNHNAIVTREEAQAVRKIFKYRNKNNIDNGIKKCKMMYPFTSKIICEECGSNFRRRKVSIKNVYEIVEWSCSKHLTDISKCKQKAVREDCIKKAFVNMWNKLSNYYEEILLPILTIFQAVPATSNQELMQIENQIQNIKRQSYMLQKVLSDGDIGSAVFIERKNQLELELENILRKQQMLKSQMPFERNRQLCLRIKEAPLPLNGNGANHLYKVHSGILHSVGATIGRSFSAQLSSFSASFQISTKGIYEDLNYSP